MRIKTLKLAESIRITPAAEEKFIDFTGKYKDWSGFYHDGIVYIVGKSGEWICTSMANIRQMVIEKDDILIKRNSDGAIEAIEHKKVDQSKISRVRPAKQSD